VNHRHWLTVQPGAHLLSDAIISSPILSGDRSASIPEEFGGTGEGAGPSAAAGGASNFEFGVDPTLDPELAMVRLFASVIDNVLYTFSCQALRMSMQEAQAREAAETAAAAVAQAPPAESSTTSTTVPPTAAPTTVPADPTDEEEERLLQEALAMSEEKDVDMESEEMDEDEEDEDAAIARAIEMSMKGQEDDEAEKRK
jgi:26S proteasome regulatory subunit N10